MKLLLDASITAITRRALVAAGHDVRCVAELTDTPAPTDQEVLKRALREHRILVTLDRDLGDDAIVRQHAPPMVRICNFKSTQQAQVVMQILAEHGSQLDRGAVISVEPGMLRVWPRANDD